MEVMIVGRFRILNLQPNQEPPQLAARQARSDDRAVQAVMQLPNLGAPPNPGTSGGSDATPPPELILNLNAQQNYELIVNLVNPASTSQTGSLSSLSLQA